MRRAPPFPREAATSAALLRDLEDKKHHPSILGKDVSNAKRPISCSLVDHTSGPAFGCGGNVAAEKGSILCVKAVGKIPGSVVSTAAALEHPLDINLSVDDSLHLSPCDLIPSVLNTTEHDISSNGASPPGPVAVHTLLDNKSDAPSELRATRDESSIGHKFRRMLNSTHAVANNLKVKELQWFPYLDQFKVKDRVLTSTQILEMLGPYMLEERKERIKRVVANRTYTVCPVVEGLLDLGNISAVFRSADALGFQSVHVISNETDKRYKKNRKISMGSEKWLDAELYQATGDCFEELRSRGYQIAIASLTEKAVPIFDMDWTVPTAVVFGNEYKGVSMEALQLADFCCYIPMEGMVDSFNVSVAAGIMMHHAVNDRKARAGKHGDLGEEEQRILSADFFLRHSSKSLSVIDRLLQIKQEERKTDLRSVLMGDLELDIELPEYLKLDLDKICLEFSPS